MSAYGCSAPIARWLGVFISLSLASPTVQAAKPSLAFDFGRTAKCFEVTTQLSHESGADALMVQDQKLVELKLRVSVHLLTGKISDVDEIRIEITDCDSRIRVDSFTPNTQLTSNFSEDISVTKSIERGKSLGASLGGEAPVPFGDLVAHVLPSANGGLTKREVMTEKHTRVAPQYAIVASGTIQQEHGVFFKLRSSPQTTLEGSHELVVRFLVPDNWRGDSLRVCCYATGQEKFLWTKQQATWSRVCEPLAVYLAGDSEARLAAEEHVAQQAL